MAGSPDTKECENCRREFSRPKRSGNDDWAERRFCSKRCSSDQQVVQVDIDALRHLYEVEQKSIPEVASQLGLTKSTVRLRLIQIGVKPRTRAEALAIAKPKLGSGKRGKKIVFSQEWKDHMRDARRAHADKHAKGVTHKKAGYVEITRGENKFRSVHVVAVEKRIGRRLLPNEVVHHDDEDRSNNGDENLILMTRSAHTKLHCERRRMLKNERLGQ